MYIFSRINNILRRYIMKKFLKSLRSIGIILCFIICIGSIIYITIEKNSLSEEEAVFTELQDIKDQNEKDVDMVINTEDGGILPEYRKLYEENGDMYGWIKVDGTNIDYPVMQTPDRPNYYLRRNWTGEYSIKGIPYIDERVTDNSENIFIYGHNMDDGSMFGDLPEYKDETYYKNHKYIEFNTIYERAKYEIVSVSKTVALEDSELLTTSEYYVYQHTELDTPEEFNNYWSNIKKNEYFDTGVTAKYGDRLITLSTCDYWTEGARLLVIAKKI